MPTTTPQGDEKQRGESLKALIRRQVLEVLGAAVLPGRVQVRGLWESFYRVNVLVGEDVGTTRIVSSYFVQTDHDGLILKSTPAIDARHA